MHIQHNYAIREDNSITVGYVGSFWSYYQKTIVKVQLQDQCLANNHISTVDALMFGQYSSLTFANSPNLDRTIDCYLPLGRDCDNRVTVKTCRPHVSIMVPFLQISLSLLEIYNEKVFDLLQSNKELTLAKGTGE